MDYKKYYRCIHNIYQVHFLNKKGLSKAEIRDICSAYGKVASVVETQDHHGMRFVSFRTEEETINCIQGLKDNNMIELLPERKMSYYERKDTAPVSNYNENANNEERNSLFSEKFMIQNDSFSDEPECEKFARKDKDGNYYLHFYDNKNLSQREIEDIFSPYGNVLSVTFGSKTDDKIRFIRYKTAAEVVSCIKGLQNNNVINILPQKHKNFNLATTKTGQKFNKKKPREQIRRYSNSDQVEKQENNSYSATERNSYMYNKIPQLISDVDTGSESVSQTEVKHGKIDTERSLQVQTTSKKNNLFTSRKNIPLQGVIVANIPKIYSAPYILHLLEKYEPLAVTYMNTTKCKEVRYCIIYLKTVQDAICVEEELDNLCLSGNNLIVLRQSRLTKEKL